MDFGNVIREMKAHPEKRFARKGWNGKGIYIQLQVPDKHSANTLPYIYMVTDKLISDNPDAPRGRVPWLASQTDMLAEDWVILEFGPHRCPHTKEEFKRCRFDNRPNPVRKKPKSDSVHSPAHYAKDRRYEPWDVILDWKLDYLSGTAVKYIARAGRKQQVGMTMKQSEEQDIMKAIEYLQRKLEQIRRRD